MTQAKSAPRTKNHTWSETRLVTPDLARQMRKMYVFQFQRPINPKNVTRLGNEIKSGAFVNGTQIFICVLPSGHGLIVNGNHTLEGIVESGVAQELTLTYHKIATVEDARKIYVCFDIHRTRSWADTLHTYDMKDKIPFAAKVMAALGFVQNGLWRPPSGVMASRYSRVDLLHEYAVPAHQFAASVKGAPGKNVAVLKRAPVLAVALITFKYQPSSAEEFWGRLAKDDGLSNSSGNRDPRKTLLTYLLEYPYKGSAGEGETLTACKLAWNAFFEGRGSLKALQVRAVVDPRSYPLRGTSFGDNYVPHAESSMLMGMEIEPETGEFIPSGFISTPEHVAAQANGSDLIDGE